MRRKRLLSWVLAFSLLAGMLGIPVSAEGTITITPGQDGTGSGTMTITLTIPKPAAPTAASTSKNSVTLTTVSGYEYSKDGTTYQDSPTFSGLTPDTEYTFYQRIKATDNNDASTASSAKIRTAKDTYSLTITLVIVDKDTQTITASDVTAAYGDTDKKVTATTSGNGAISYAVKSGSEDYISVNASTGALTIKKVPADGKAYVTVTAAETNTGGTGNKGYASATKDVTVTINKGTPSYTVPTGLTASFGQTLADVSLPSATNGTWSWASSGTSVGSVGTHTFMASFTPTDTDNYNTVSNIDVSVAVGTVAATVTKAPDAKTLTYTGQTQALVNAGTASGGTMQYAIGADEKTAPTTGYAADIPTGKNAGTYYVWYKAVGDSDHSDSAAACVTVIIDKAANPATVTSTASVTKGGKTVDLANNVTLNGATGTVSYEISGGDNGCTLNGSVLTSGANAGSVTVNVTVATDDNYEALSATPITVTITDKETQNITAENVTATYGDTGKSVSASVTTPASGGGAISYAVKDGGGDYIEVNASTGALTIKKAGTATVTVTAAETDDYAAATKEITVTISKAALTVKAKDQSIYVGGTVPTLGSDSYTVTGLVGTDTLTTNPTLAYSSTPDNTKAGSYTITPSGAAAGDNYEISYQNGTLTISVRPTPSTPSSRDRDDSSDSTPATTTVTVPVSGEDKTVNVSVTVSGDTATVRNTDIDAVLSETAETGTVTIDVSNVGTEITEAVIPSAMVEKITEAVADENNDADGLEVKLSTGTVTFDATALEAISEQMTGRDLRLNLDDIGENKLTSTQQAATKDMDVQAVYDAYVTSNGQRITDFKGGKATITVPYELKAEQRAAGVTVWYVADNGDKTEMPSTYDGKDVKFTVEHFSNYVIAYDEERAAVCPQDDTCPISKFTDADPTAWYHDGMHYVLENGIMSGFGNGLFGPGRTTSRAMMARILWNMEGKPVVNYAMSYTDVDGEQWCADAVRWATAEKIMSGYGDGVFGPNDAMTREQLAVILYRYAKYKGVDVSVGEDTNILSYDDAMTVSEYAIPAMQWAVGSGIITGYNEDGVRTLRPGIASSRAVVATMLMRYCTEVAK